MLIKHLFDLAKMDENNFQIHPEWLQLGNFIHHIVERIQPILTEKGIAIHIHCPEDLKVFIDSERFQQVFLNLFDNAQKHADGESTVHVRVSLTDQHIVIKIINQGEDIPKKDLPYIFDRLYRVEKSRSRQSGGAGLGLSISKEIVEAHGGSIQMETTQNRKTSVVITLVRGESTDEKGINC